MLQAGMGIGALTLIAGSAFGQNLLVTFENVGPADGVAFTPLWVGFHDGSFDSYDGGAPASAGIEQIAELGQTGLISSEFNTATGGNGFDTTLASSDGPPPFLGGQSQTFELNVTDTTNNRYFSYASMVIPSNDLFIANGNPFAHLIFNVDGSFAGPVTIDIFGREVNDAGTEANSVLNGGAFVDGVDATLGGPGEGLIANIGELATDPLDDILGTLTPPGFTVNQGFGADTLIARITIEQVPTPGAGVLAAIGGLAAMRRRRH
ncbi:MAG: spondin domain-containing protein [Planctomycetota bacterium]